jgi:predicted nucleic acid-binding protein
MGIIKTHYLDASAIVKLLIHEDGSAVLKQYFEKHSVFYTTSLCFVETLGVLKAKVLQNSITQDQYLTACEILMGQVRDQFIGIDEINIADPQIYREVDRIAKDYSLDISDAFQILTLKKGFLSPFRGTASECILITADRKLADAARQENLKVWNCLHDPVP